ncbi:hypothetical protein GOP47_0028827 [Adiantum capillus-veneris]|nr:hypothetical protein GOP47_0028827 [Adiantum capillus-veneris]
MACTLEGGLQDTQNLIAGLCTVEFVSTGSYQRSSLEAWTYNLALTTAKYFATDYCAQNLKVIFYGIEQNAACAAHAFAATFNRVSNLAADFVPKKLLEEGDRIEIDRIKQYPNTSTFFKKVEDGIQKRSCGCIIPNSRGFQMATTRTNHVTCICGSFC